MEQFVIKSLPGILSGGNYQIGIRTIQKLYSSSGIQTAGGCGTCDFLYQTDIQGRKVGFCFLQNGLREILKPLVQKLQLPNQKGQLGFLFKGIIPGLYRQGLLAHQNMDAVLF